jgi:hypothetical protein
VLIRWILVSSTLGVVSRLHTAGRTIIDLKTWFGDTSAVLKAGQVSRLDRDLESVAWGFFITDWSLSSLFVLPAIVIDKHSAFAALKHSYKLAASDAAEHGLYGARWMFVVLAAIPVIGWLVVYFVTDRQFLPRESWYWAIGGYWLLLFIAGAVSRAIYVAALYRQLTRKDVTPGFRWW